MQINGYSFEQPYTLITRFNNVSAIYVVYTVVSGRTVWLDVGETDKLGDRIANHDRKNCWLRQASSNKIYIGIKQEADEFTRRQVEADLRNQLLPLCGER